MTKLAPTLICALACCLGSVVCGGEPVAAGLLACEKIQDTAERAHCYDAQLAAMKTAGSPAQQPAAPEQTPSKRYDAEDLPPKERPKPEAGHDVLVSRITSIRTVGPQMWLIGLENAQVWRQDGAERTSFFKPGDVVHIEKGVLGDHLLSADRIGDKYWVRVIRIK